MSSLTEATQNGLRPWHSPEQFHGPSTPQNSNVASRTLPGHAVVPIRPPRQNCIEHLPPVLLGKILEFNGDTFIDCQLLSKRAHHLVQPLLSTFLLWNKKAIFEETTEVSTRESFLTGRTKAFCSISHCSRDSFFTSHGRFTSDNPVQFHCALRLKMNLYNIHIQRSKVTTVWELRCHEREALRQRDKKHVVGWFGMLQVINDVPDEMPGLVINEPNWTSEEEVRESARQIRAWALDNRTSFFAQIYISADS